ncbi:Fe-S cluster assembly protein SufD [Pseudomonas sp. MMS21-TM103]|uniref:Fe-S cluster assembly protein SufD n=1 Tax=Pseudomonas sp. MMS21 TM103 TaxID=2886506 RepID=UPI001EE025FE|nr:Fe-S cluster assembly protein SufD [Pseudomonas sp. MMS21 TM103]MCG4453191.1 Fe-S cluster assembly protein SufD [Pseudomonas sp. MMS21 TM103]
MNTATLVPLLTSLQAAEPARQPAWRRQSRDAAWRWLAEHGFPTTRDEAWKYTRLAPILAVPFQAAAAPPSRRLSTARLAQWVGDYGGPRLVFVNGLFVTRLSALAGLPAGVRLSNLAALPQAERAALEPLLTHSLQVSPHAFGALNAALGEDGAVLQIPAHCTLERPIHLVFLADPGAAPLAVHSRSLIQLGAGSRATLVESHVASGAGVYLSNPLSQVVLEAGAALEHYSLQDSGRSAFHLARLDVRQARDSRFSAHLTACGGAIARHEVRVALEGPGAQVALDGLYLPGGEQHLDNQTCIEHLAPYCTSRERYKGVIGGRAHGVFDGRIIVRPGAIKTDASQTIKNLLLTATAQANAQPRLEIFADDVKCAHGAAVGQLDRQAIFYLRSRGLDEPAARSLLTYAFVGELLEAIHLAPLRAEVQRLVVAQLRSLELTP